MIDEVLSISPDSARSFFALLTDFFSNDSKLLLGVVRRLLPARARVEQLLWNELPLVVSPHELLGEVDPFLLTPSVLPNGSYSSVTEYLDTYFRLMRYEGFGQLRQGIRSFLAGKLDARDMNVYQGVAVHGVRFGSGGDAAMTLLLTYSPLVWRGRAAAEIMFGNLLCLSLDGSFKEPLWAVVAHCQANSGKTACAHVQLCTAYNQHDDLTALMLLQHCKTTLMAESPTYFNAVRPVLRCLQLLDSDCLPFESELVHGCRPMETEQTGSSSAPAYIQPSSRLDATSVFPHLQQPQTDIDGRISVEVFLEMLRGDDDHYTRVTTFDKSQMLSIAAALQQRLTVIQGPPGTGKSFVGRTLACLLLSLDTRPPGPIIVLTYKNHALDEVCCEFSHYSQHAPTIFATNHLTVPPPAVAVSSSSTVLVPSQLKASHVLALAPSPMCYSIGTSNRSCRISPLHQRLSIGKQKTRYVSCSFKYRI